MAQQPVRMAHPDPDAGRGPAIDTDEETNDRAAELAERRAAYQGIEPAPVCINRTDYIECSLLREREAADEHKPVDVCPVHGPQHDEPNPDGERPVYAIEEGGSIPGYDLCSPCIAATHDPDQTLRDIVRRDDSLHCVGCDFHRACGPECYAVAPTDEELPAGATVEPWDARDDAEEAGEAWSRALRNANAWRRDTLARRYGNPDNQRVFTRDAADDLGIVPSVMGTGPGPHFLVTTAFDTYREQDRRVWSGIVHATRARGAGILYRDWLAAELAIG